ncbi:class I SAM-dependent methyltransferase [Iamia sp. SCSIO 61187]|uniref:class I SAM-dependent methyltransferase n=1 Tax=Iamia sp. SCSIO 61187 TaxID=2722752 RepID=UPI001C62949D|nr:class I SAM-dependent methyltransferase [Iamia sp. SCSIO 61187]QYG94569.1 class I SAM-dependent methyltransferase [Iamia sp. SCSIO 61187]
MEGYDAATYGDRFADVYDDWYDDPDATEAAVAALVARARAVAPAGTTTPSLLELGAGTGRLALPLAAAGLAVTGVDASTAMFDRLAAKPGGSRVTAVVGDMAGPLPDGPFDLVVVARNTFFNLTTEAAQRACLREVARVLAPGGRLVLEAFVPTDDDGPTSSVEVRSITADRVLLFVDRHDPATSEAWSSFVDISPDGIRLRPCHVRYLRPADLDALAAACGLALDDRAEDWAGARFDDTSAHHVSTYRRSDPGSAA